MYLVEAREKDYEGELKKENKHHLSRTKNTNLAKKKNEADQSSSKSVEWNSFNTAERKVGEGSGWSNENVVQVVEE